MAPLDVPDALVQGFSAQQFAGRSMLGPLRFGADALVLSSGWRPLASCYSLTPRGGDDTRLLALGSFMRDEADAVLAWERLIERACLRAAGAGKMRVLARPEEGSEGAGALRRLGFTAVTGEEVYARPLDATRRPRQPGFEPLQRDDVWDVWKLYSRTEPLPVQRAEGLSPASWWRGRRARRRPRGEFILRAGGDVVVHQELLFGPGGAAVALHYEPEHRDAVEPALEHALAISAERGARVVYCTAREHQADMRGPLEALGFGLVRVQTRLVLYTTVLSYAREARALPGVERARVLRPTPSPFSSREAGATAESRWYNSGEG